MQCNIPVADKAYEHQSAVSNRIGKMEHIFSLLLLIKRDKKYHEEILISV
jgi:hypothetical protein